MWVASSPGQELGPGAVDEHQETRQETRVVGEGPGRREVDVPPLVGNAERRPCENRFGTAREHTPCPRRHGASRHGFAFG